MRLSKQTSDAIKILVLCAGAEDGLIKVADVASQLDLTKPLGLKLVNLLARLGFVETVRGRHGGLRLSHDPRTLTVGRVVREMEAFSVSGGTASDPAGFGSFVDDAFEAFLSVLDRHTIADMARASAPAAGAVAPPPADSKVRGRRKSEVPRTGVAR